MTNSQSSRVFIIFTVFISTAVYLTSFKGIQCDLLTGKEKFKIWTQDEILSSS